MKQLKERCTQKATARTGAGGMGGRLQRQERRRWRGPGAGAAATTELLQKLPPRVISAAQACGFLALATRLQLPVYFSTNRMPPSVAVSIQALREKRGSEPHPSGRGEGAVEGVLLEAFQKSNPPAGAAAGKAARGAGGRRGRGGAPTHPCSQLTPSPHLHKPPGRRAQIVGAGCILRMMSPKF